MRLSTSLSAACVVLPVLVSSVSVSIPDGDFGPARLTCTDNDAELTCLWKGLNAGFTDCQVNGSVASSNFDTQNMHIECLDGTWGTLFYEPANGFTARMTCSPDAQPAAVKLQTKLSVSVNWFGSNANRHYKVICPNENQLGFVLDMYNRVVVSCDSKVPTETVASSKIPGGPSYEFNNKMVSYVCASGYHGKFEFTDRGTFVEEGYTAGGIGNRKEY